MGRISRRRKEKWMFHGRNGQTGSPQAHVRGDGHFHQVACCEGHENSPARSGSFEVAIRSTRDEQNDSYYFDNTENLLEKAKSDDPKAQLAVGLGFLSTDPWKGISWLEKASENGEVEAQLALGMIFAVGNREVPPDLSKAVSCFRKAAESGDSIAQFTLGQAYRFGNGVPKDLAEGSRLIRLSAENGLPAAQFALAEAYLRGESLGEDNFQAIKWLTSAADQGHVEAQRVLFMVLVIGLARMSQFGSSMGRHVH